MAHFGCSLADAIVATPAARGDAAPPAPASKASNVYWHAPSGRWRVSRREDGKCVYYGSRATYAEALTLAIETGVCAPEADSEPPPGPRPAPAANHVLLPAGRAAEAFVRFKHLGDVFQETLPADVGDLFQRTSPRPGPNAAGKLTWRGAAHGVAQLVPMARRVACSQELGGSWMAWRLAWHGSWCGSDDGAARWPGAAMWALARSSGLPGGPYPPGPVRLAESWPSAGRDGAGRD